MIIRVRDFFCFARLVDVLIPIYSFSYDTGGTEVCPHDIRGEAPKVHPRLFCLSIKPGQMCLHDLPSSIIFVYQRFGAWLEFSVGRAPQGETH